MSKTWTPHLLIAWGGSIGNPALDSWTNTLKAFTADASGVSVPFTEAEQDEWLGLAQPIVSAWVGQASPIGTHGGAVYLEWIKANMIAATGKYMYANTSIYDYPAPVQGKGATPCDWRQSLVVTLRTDVSRGRAHAGRFYPPVTPLQPETVNTPYISEANASAFVLAAANMIGSLDGLTLASGKSALVSVFSPGETAVGLEPVYNGVVKFECDRVLDTQRRRTNRVPRQIVTNV